MRHPHFLMVRWLASGILLMALAVSGALGAGAPLRVAVAQEGANLLQNPGFEPPFVARNSDSSLQVAAGWEPWYLTTSGPTGINARPDYLPAPAARVRSGSGAQEYNTFFATHTAGVYQRVAVPAGTELRFSVWVWVWSSATFDDENVSEDPNEVQVSVGIDPTGGTDAESPNVVWSAEVEFYDEYRELSVVATASSAAVTVFVRSAPENFVGTTNIYLDDAGLYRLGEAPPPQPTAVPPSPTPGQGVPTQEGSATPRPTPAITFTPPPSFTPAITLPPSATPVVPATPLPSVTPFPTHTPPAVTATPVLPGEFDSSVVYTVQAGDSVSRLAQRFGSTIDAIVRVNGLSDPGLIYVGQTLVIPIRSGTFPVPPTFTPAPIYTPGSGFPTAAPVPPTAPPAGLGTYTVQPGDILSVIAARYNTTVATLAQLNNLVNPNLIYVGQVLRVPQAAPAPAPAPIPAPPQPVTHVVQPGDNLYRISVIYGVPVDAIIRVNNIRNPNLIFVGQTLVIPR